MYFLCSLYLPARGTSLSESVSKVNAHSLCHGNKLAAGIDILGRSADNILERNCTDCIALEGNHLAEIALHAKLNRRIAVAGGEDSVVCGGGASALNVTEGGCSCLTTYKLLELVRNYRADTAETDRIGAVLAHLEHYGLSVNRLCALGYCNDGKLLAVFLVCLDLLGNLVDIVLSDGSVVTK